MISVVHANLEQINRRVVVDRRSKNLTDTERKPMAARRKAAPRSASEIRKKALAVLVEQWGGPTNLAHQLDVTPGYVSQLLSGERPITEKTAEKIERKLSLTSGFMSRTHENDIKPAVVDTRLITQVINTVGTLAEEAGITLAPQKFADVVTLVYEEATRTQTIDETYIARVLRLTK